ncbi:MAG: phytanoyl-CoA dioxygenase family protein [Actinomycetota bacterium]|nr:phytanoyl-CoA dioxygenase family protein [Actinomycetota bacterium]
MSYPSATPEQVLFFRGHGYLVVEDAIAEDDLRDIERWCDEILDNKETVANDWAWDERESIEERSFRIVQANPFELYPELNNAIYRTWAADFGSALMGLPVAFKYDQFLAKPPEKSVPTWWHQDEGYWGRVVENRGITCWIPLQDVDVDNGCMHFLDGAHKEGVLTHRRVEGLKSDLLTCDVDEARVVPCPISRKSVTFHHSATPHMATANRSTRWRKALTQHLWDPTIDYGPAGGDFYPWRVVVPQSESSRRAIAGG